MLGPGVVFTDDQVQLLQVTHTTGIGEGSFQQVLPNAAALITGGDVHAPDKPFVMCFQQLFLPQSHRTDEFIFIAEGTKNRTSELLEVLDIARPKISRELLECLQHQTMVGVGIFGREYLDFHSTWPMLDELTLGITLNSK